MMDPHFSVLGYEDKLREYNDRKLRYEDGSFVTKLLMIVTGKRPKKPGPYRVAVKYGSLGLPFRHTEYWDAPFIGSGGERHSIDYLPDESIDDLWTVVEFDGENTFTDLITGVKFHFSHVPEKIDYMLKYTSADDDAKYNNAEEVYTDLLDAPLAIADSSAIVELSAELKERILDETVPQAEHIKKVIAERAAHAREAVESAYGAKMSDIREKRKTVLSIREKEAERERKYKEEQRRRQEQEKKWMQKESERLKMVDPSFDKVFPKKR